PRSIVRSNGAASHLSRKPLARTPPEHPRILLLPLPQPDVLASISQQHRTVHNVVEPARLRTLTSSDERARIVDSYFRSRRQCCDVVGGRSVSNRGSPVVSHD